MSEKIEESDDELFEVLSSYGDLNIEETEDDSTTEEELSETSADRSFVASESDDATYSEESLESSLPCIHHAMDGHNTSGAVSASIRFLLAVELTRATRSAKRSRLEPLPLVQSPKRGFR
jgi:hypothetical protein